MSKLLLHVDSSILGANSASRALSAAVVAKLLQDDPRIEVTQRDLAAAPIPHLSGAYLAAGAAGGTSHAAELQTDLALGAAVMQEFLAAEVVVVGLGFYNFGIPSQLKAWVDRLAVAGKTFRYGENGPVGLAGGKRVILVIARGGFYGPGTPTEAFEHAESYLRAVFGFIGISQIDVVSADGLAAGPELRLAGMAKAEARIAALAA